MSLPAKCQPSCDRPNWVYHPVGEGAVYVRQNQKIEHKGYAGKVLTTCKVCGGFIGYCDNKVLRESLEKWAKKQAKKQIVQGVELGEEIEGVGI